MARNFVVAILRQQNFATSGSGATWRLPRDCDEPTFPRRAPSERQRHAYRIVHAIARLHHRPSLHGAHGGTSGLRFDLVCGTSRRTGREREPVPATGGAIPWTYSHFTDPYIALARASGVTTTLKLATGITLMPQRNPLLLAKEIAALDHHSGGRFILGVGTGWLREEVEIFGGNFARRWTQTREALDVMKALWSQEAAEFHGEFFDFPPVRSYPKPVQKPHPPIVLGGAAKNVFRRVSTTRMAGYPIALLQRTWRKLARNSIGWQRTPAAIRNRSRSPSTGRSRRKMSCGRCCTRAPIAWSCVRRMLRRKPRWTHNWSGSQRRCSRDPARRARLQSRQNGHAMYSVRRGRPNPIRCLCIELLGRMPWSPLAEP